MNRYYLGNTNGEMWPVMLDQLLNGVVSKNDWIMCVCQSKKDAEEIVAALNFCETMAVMHELQEAYMKNEVS